ncbi:dUTP diphosphatase [Terrihabitans sp. B22-R8]|uniref:dUTP diphosphatase n=1 Tax=Terrihabitans sp. B22-R8 TaxID=3425128 RepID=UPI00403CE150
MSIRIAVTRLPHAAGLPLPAYETSGAAGLDLLAAVEEASPLRLSPGERRLVPTGLVMELPAGYEAQVRPRSGLAFRHGVTVLNAPGTIDADYRGEVQVLLINLGTEDFVISRGMRIAQMIISRVETVDLWEADVLSETTRGAGGFGSTGTGHQKADV